MIKTILADGTAEKVYLEELRERRQATDNEVTRAVSDILEAVRLEGDAAVRRFTAKFDHVDGPIGILEAEDIKKGAMRVEPKLLQAMTQAAANIRAFHERQKAQGFVNFQPDGTFMGQRVLPLERVGLYVPGGTAAYPSSVLMNAIPAKIAGVKELVMVTPPQKEGGLRDVILAAASLAGVDRIYLAGGAQAVAAMAYGTETIPRVDKIVGPGNIFVATAKKLLYGTVGIDMVAGPSEILIVADQSANPRFVAADLMSQCEHDKRAGGVLLTNSQTLAQEVQKELESQMMHLERADIIRTSLADYGAMLVFPTLDQCFDFANELAPEHLEIACQDAAQYLGKVNNAGSVFLGQWTPEPVGDYFAGTNHVLPTGGTARFFSPLGVESFVKRMQFTCYSKTAITANGDDIVRFAESEGLTAHANAVKVRNE